MLDVLDAAAVRRWSRLATRNLESHRAELDRLNVFPVHDSDTGSNLAATLRAAADALAAHETDNAAEALRVLARGAVLGASGNSGNIVAQLLRALADAAAESASCDAAMLRHGLRSGALQARAAVADPVEGTILTVATAAAQLPPGTLSLAEVAGLALAAADEALARTPQQLPALAEAGVVDAGARGLVLLLEALVRVIGGDVPELTTVPDLEPSAAAHGTRPDGGDGLAFDVPAFDVPAFEVPAFDVPAFEVQYLLDTTSEFTDAHAGELRTRLAQLGDSVVVVGTGEDPVRTWSVHVHTDDAGAAVEAGIAVGRPYRIAVSPLDDHAAAPKPVAVLAVAPGQGIGRLFEGEGVHVVGAQEHSDLTVDDLVAAVAATGARQVVLLPNAHVLGGAADTAARRMRETGMRVAVVPTRSPVQGLAAVAVHDAHRRFDDDVVAMAEAAAATRVAEVIVAENRALTTAGIAQAGDVVGLIEGEVVEIGRGVLAVALALVDRLLGVGAELMTVLVGADAAPGTGELLRRHVRERSPLTEVGVYDTGQPGAPLIIGVE